MDLVLDVNLFDMRMINTGDICVAVGRRGTGKTFLMRDIMYHFRDTPVPWVVNATESMNRFYSYHVPSICIRTECTPEVMTAVFDRQRSIVDLCYEDFVAKGHDIHDPSDNFRNFVLSDECSYDPRVFLILDDCMYDKSWLQSTLTRELFCNGRHFFITVCITMQYVLGFGPLYRGQMDYIFLLSEKMHEIRKRLHSTFGAALSFEYFCQVLDGVHREKGDCLVIKNNGVGELSETFYHYRAKERGRFCIGSDALWTRDAEHQRMNAMRKDLQKHANSTRMTSSNSQTTKKRQANVTVLKRMPG